MHQGTIFEVRESRSEAPAAEAGFEATVFGCRDAKALGHNSKCKLHTVTVCFFKVTRDLWGIVLKKRRENEKWK